MLGLDPGHGGWDPGSVGSNGLLEKEVTLDVAQRLVALLKTRGIPHYAIRLADQAVSDVPSESQELKTRVALLNNMKCTEVISIHVNSNANPKPNYLACYLAREVSRPLANCLIKHLKEELKLDTGGDADGVREAYHYITKNLNIPAVIIELGFISNPTWEAFLKTTASRERIAKALFKAICEYYKIDTVKEDPNKWKYEAIKNAIELNILKSEHNPLEIPDKGFVVQVAVSTYKALWEALKGGSE